MEKYHTGFYGLSLGGSECRISILELRLCPFYGGTLYSHIGKRHGKLGLCLTDPGLEVFRVDTRDNLALMYLRIKVRVKFLDLAGDLRAYLYRSDRGERTGGGYRADDLPQLGPRETESGTRTIAIGVRIRKDCRNKDQGHNNEQRSFAHVCISSLY